MGVNVNISARAGMTNRVRVYARFVSSKFVMNASDDCERVLPKILRDF